MLFPSRGPSCLFQLHACGGPVFTGRIGNDSHRGKVWMGSRAVVDTSLLSVNRVEGWDLHVRWHLSGRPLRQRMRCGRYIYLHRGMRVRRELGMKGCPEDRPRGECNQDIWIGHDRYIRVRMGRTVKIGHVLTGALSTLRLRCRPFGRWCRMELGGGCIVMRLWLRSGRWRRPMWVMWTALHCLWLVAPDPGRESTLQWFPVIRQSCRGKE